MNAKSEIYIYTDCARFHGWRVMKMSALIIDTDESEKTMARIRYDADTRSELNIDNFSGIDIHLGEMAAIYDVLKHIYSDARHRSRSGGTSSIMGLNSQACHITIYTDSNCSFLTINNMQRFKDKSIGHIRMLNLCKKYIKILSDINITIDVQWVPGHAGIYGNDTAHTIARPTEDERMEFHNRARARRAKEKLDKENKQLEILEA